MTDAEIKKALEVCAYLEACADCPFGDIEGVDKCMHSMMQDALDLINRQQAEIERLKYNLEAVLNERADHSEAIEEFVYRLQMECGTFNNGYYQFADYEIDNLKEKMVGDAE